MLEHSMLYPKTTLTRRRISMDGMWKFHLDERSVGENEGWIDGIPGEEMIPVPASFQDFYTEKDIREYTGDFWYETDFFVPGEWEGREPASVWSRNTSCQCLCKWYPDHRA